MGFGMAILILFRSRGFGLRGWRGGLVLVGIDDGTVDNLRTPRRYIFTTDGVIRRRRTLEDGEEETE